MSEFKFPARAHPSRRIEKRLLEFGRGPGPSEEARMPGPAEPISKLLFGGKVA